MRQDIKAPKNHMFYDEYRTAAIKHINTCKYLINSISNDNNINDVVKERILRNIYYLAGYIIECSVNYTIYKKLGWITRPIHELEDKVFKVSFQSIKGRYVIKYHNYAKNMELLDLLISGDKYSEIPIIGGNLMGFSSTSKKLFYAWNPAIRYENSKKINDGFVYSEISEFVSLATEIYISLLKS